MKLAVFSDIHGNIYAFKKALDQMRKIGVDEYIFCGDAVGYYYHSNEVIEALRGLKKLHSVVGNHDLLFLDIFQGDNDVKSYIEKYGVSLSNLKQSITYENFIFLKNLVSKRSLVIDNIKILLVHGSPWDPINEYVYPSHDFSKYRALDFDLVFQGHTHYRMKVKEGSCKIINPGSIGQPRDGKGPSFVVYDTLRKKTEFHEITYDVNKLIQEVKAIGNEPEYLTSVLKRIIYDE